MRPLRPLFGRHNRRGELEREAERLKNRDWVEMLRVVHPSQAQAAEREYLLSRLRSDWAELAGKLLATHSMVANLNGKTLTVLCDHNTFANELAMLAPVISKKIEARYSLTLKIQARASSRIDWQKPFVEDPAQEKPAEKAAEKPPGKNSVIDELISRLE